MKKLKANVCAVTHAGRIRRENEDNYNLNGRMTSTGDLRKGSAFVQNMAEPFHLSVCDGMGGESYGELASGIAVETIAAHANNVFESGEDFSFAISNCLDDANSRICAEINARGKRMGTTLAAVYAVKGNIICVNIGDTRIYHYSKGILEQISFDHTHAQQIVDAGQAKQSTINSIPDAKRLTRHLGVFPEEASLSPNISVIDDVDDGDILLLCSDGLTDMLSDDDISSILSSSESSQDAASKLIRSALEKGGKDNITVMAAFMSVEETAIFTPIAAAMVGDSDANYEDEYRVSYGSNKPAEDEQDVASPYANADARAYTSPKDQKKKLIIVGIVVAALIVVFAAALITKAVISNKQQQETTTTVYNYYQDYTTYSIPAYETISTMSFTTSSTQESSTEESTTEKTTAFTTRRYTTTTRKASNTATTKKTTSATKPAATTSKPATTTTAVSDATTASGETTTGVNTTSTTSGETTTGTGSETTTNSGSETTLSTPSTSETTSTTSAENATNAPENTTPSENNGDGNSPA